MTATRCVFAPKKCTQEAFDADEHAQNLTDWHQQYDQLSTGCFYGRIDELAFPTMQVFKEHTGQALRQECRVWDESLWLGIPSHPLGSRINGQPLAQREIMCRPGGQAFELVTPARFDIYGLVIQLPALRAAAAEQGVELDSRIQQLPRREASAKTLASILFLLERLLCQRQAIAGKLHQDILLTGLLELLKSPRPGHELPPSYAHRKAVVDCVKTYMESHQNGPITMQALCQLTHVSRRTLQYSFTSILGISPLQFLRVTRLNRVRRALRAADTSQTVTDIATYWGFWHLGQFAHDYKQQFGECPSRTLAQAHRQANPG